jgi:hypothetical protein
MNRGSENFVLKNASTYKILHEILTNNYLSDVPPIRTVSNNIGTKTGKNNLSPGRYSLEHNYPNPFNPTTTIKFALPKDGYVKLKVYDIMGREVKVIVNEVKQAGYYSVDFDGSNLASGVYFYRLQCGSFNETKRMVIIK